MNFYKLDEEKNNEKDLEEKEEVLGENSEEVETESEEDVAVENLENSLSLDGLSDEDMAGLEDFLFNKEENDDNLSSDGSSKENEVEEVVESEPIAQTLPEKEERKSKIYDTAKVFGVSEETMESEFNAFKAAKLFKRMNLMLCDNALSEVELKNMVKSAVETGFDSVTVLPNRVKTAVLAANGKIAVRAAVCYPFGAECLKVKISSIRLAVKQGATSVELPFDVYDLSGRKQKAVVKEWKTLVKKAGKASLIATLDVDKLTYSEITQVAKICKDAGVLKIKTSPCVVEADLSRFTTGGVGSSFGDVKYEIGAKTPTAEQALSMFRSGAETFSTPRAIEVAKEIKVILGC